jgi:hypothetical protein
MTPAAARAGQRLGADTAPPSAPSPSFSPDSENVSVSWPVPTALNTPERRPRSSRSSIIATRCIVDGYRLLHSDRDFDPFVTHLGLAVVGCGV